MISVVIANFNKKELLQRCLDSVLKQDFKDIEIIVVDNGSSDGSVEMVRSFPEVNLIQNAENLLFCKAYNQGIVASNGRFILINRESRPRYSFAGRPLINCVPSPSVRRTRATDAFRRPVAA